MARRAAVLLALLSLWGGQAGAQVATTAATPPLSATYKLGVADKIRITVFNEPTLSGDFLINADGSVSLPLIGNMIAAGSSAVELQAVLEAKFGEGFLRDPHVGVEVLTYRPFYIYGQVTRPGEYPYSQGLSVLKAVALAQGFTNRANKKTPYVQRAGGGVKEVPVTVDAPIQPGDVIRIADRNF